MNKIERLVIQNLLKHGFALELNLFIKGFPPKIRKHVLKAVRRLQSLGYIHEEISSEGVVIKLNENMKKEALQMVSSIYIPDPSQDPIEEIVPKTHKILKIINAEHKQNGGLGKYVICCNKKDKYDIRCYIRNTKGKVGSVHVGSIYEPNSLVVRFTEKIDEVFPNSFFTKEDVKNEFPTELRGNNQPTKAVIEYLCYEKFLIRMNYAKGPSKYQRTGKKIPITTLDEILVLHDKQPMTMTFNGGRYAYTEEDGLYPILL